MDRCLTHGLGLFETLLALDGRALFWEKHMERLLRSCAVFGWDVDVTAAGAAMGELLERNGLSQGRARIRLTVSGGEGGLRDVRVASGRTVWMTAGLADVPPDSLSVGISRWRKNRCSPLAGHKSASYAENLFLLQEARDHGWDEVLVFNHSGHLSEAATANVFLVVDGALLTPALSSGCLPGVAREVVIGMAGGSGSPCAEVELTESDLLRAEELFLTSATRGVVPVSRIGEHRLECGPVARCLRDAWWEMAMVGRV